MALLKAKLLAVKEEQEQQQANSNRKNQIGSGMRGDKTRTIRVLDNQVKDHLLQSKMRFTDYERGYIDGLWE